MTRTVTNDDGTTSEVTELVSQPITLAGHHAIDNDNPSYRIKTVPALRQAEMTDYSLGYRLALPDMTQRADGDNDETRALEKYTEKVTIWAVGNGEKTVDSDRLEVSLRTEGQAMTEDAAHPVFAMAEADPRPAQSTGRAGETDPTPPANDPGAEDTPKPPPRRPDLKGGRTMPPKRNRPLRDQQGLAMILVLCLGALFVALAAALVYAASLMMANADRQLPEQDVYELAVSFSDVLEQELLHYTGAKEKDGAMTEENDQSIGYFINHIYVKKGSIDNPYGDDTDHTFTLQAPEGIDEMTVTLNKHPSDDVDEGGNVIDTEPITENLSNLLIKLRNQSENGSTMNVDDYVIRVTVKVVKGDQSYSYTRKYKHTGIYSYYYTLDDNANTRYSFSGAEGDTALRLTNMATREERTVTKNDASTLYLRYSMDTDSACIFTRINGNDE